jgi:hypothetical protein
VTFKQGAVILGTATLSSGAAGYTAAGGQLPGGSDVITAVYSGDSNHASSTSPSFTETVNKASTTTALTSSANPVGANQPVSFTAALASAAGIPVGNVVFKDGKTTIATVASSSGVATLNITFAKTGQHTIHANYQGNGNYSSSTAKLLQTVK